MAIGMEGIGERGLATVDGWRQMIRCVVAASDEMAIRKRSVGRRISY